MKSNEILRLAAIALSGKKAVDLFAIRIGDLTVLTDYFLIANGTSTTHVRALAEEVEEKLSEQGLQPNAIEGKATGWILLDYGCVLVHVFVPEARSFYNLENLWKDGTPVSLAELGVEDADKQ